MYMYIHSVYTFIVYCCCCCLLSSETGGRRQGFMGHLMKMVNLLVRCGETDQGLAAIMRETMAEEVQQRWNQFLSGTVADSNRKNETNLVCVLVCPTMFLVLLCGPTFAVFQEVGAI